MRRAGAVAGLAAGLALTAGVASAHELAASGFQSPVPLPWLYAGAGATVALTAGWLGLGDRGSAVSVVRNRADGAPSLDRPVAHLSPRVAQTAAHVARGGFLVVFAVALVHGVVGPAAPAENLATVVLWPLVLKGVGLLAVVAGTPWRLLSPWETLYDLLVAVEGDRLAVLGSYPDRLGSWPALVAFLGGVGVLENLTVVTRSPSLTVGVVGLYASLLLAGGVAFGREFFARADALAVLFGLLGRVAMVRVERTAAGGARITLRAPWTGCTRPVRDASVAAFVVAAVYTVSFDGFTATATFQTLRFATREALGAGVAGVGLYLAGVVVFLASYAAATTLAARLGRTGDLTPSAAVTAFAGTVVPIAAAYEVAHNYPAVVANLGRALTIGRDVLRGVDGAALDLLAWLPVAGFWASQVALIVGGHVVGVVAAHRVASGATETPAARRVHAPLVAVMVGYTVLSLWIVSQPLAT